MRYPPEHKDRVREKIVHAASRRFRGHGRAVGIAQLMRELKLTHGGFYRHFSSKDELFNEALMASIKHMKGRMLEAAEKASPDRALEQIVSTYLSIEHCNHPADGCPLAALTTEIARQPMATRRTFERLLRIYSATFAPWMPGRTRAQREHAAMVLFSGMAGVLNAARAVPDEALRRALLEQGRDFFLRSLRVAP
ncbi:MAG: TetR/AcrR family transcriptional regulator [Myxococcaceae bacterium]|nr:TetR/AcrR family transcriptional regulator [Myxococcaceae bacterium]